VERGSQSPLTSAAKAAGSDGFPALPSAWGAKPTAAALAPHTCLGAAGQALGGLILHRCQRGPLSRSYDNLCPAENPTLYVFQIQLFPSTISDEYYKTFYFFFSFLKCQVDLLQQLLRR